MRPVRSRKPNENNNTATQSIVVGRGASIPFTSHEAESGRYQGQLLEADAKRTFGHTNFSSESSGRRSVRLDSRGQFVEITSTVSTNSIVVRNSIPDAAGGGGGGKEAKISLYASNQFVQKLTLLANNALIRTGGAFWGEQQFFGAITLFAQNLPIPGVTIRDTEIVDYTYDGIQFKGGGGEMPNVQITNSAQGDIVVEPGSGFVIG